MKIRVRIYPVGSGPTRRQDATQLEVQCGAGEQLIQWLARAACLKLAYVNRDAVHQYVPQAVLSKDYSVLDIDQVLKEVRL